MKIRVYCHCECDIGSYSAAVINTLFQKLTLVDELEITPICSSLPSAKYFLYYKREECVLNQNLKDERYWKQESVQFKYGGRGELNFDS